MAKFGTEIIAQQLSGITTESLEITHIAGATFDSLAEEYVITTGTKKAASFSQQSGNPNNVELDDPVTFTVEENQSVSSVLVLNDNEDIIQHFTVTTISPSDDVIAIEVTVEEITIPTTST